jgi:acyl-CoA synthetase (AMP-forming)/AMP-acid ligase II
MYEDLIHSLRALAASQPDAVLYRFLKDGEDEAVSLCRREADHAARAVAAELQSRDLHGRRVLIALPPGLDYVACVLGCLYAGVVAVPAAFPLRDGERQRFRNVCVDCTPSAVIVNRSQRTPQPEWDGLALLDAAELIGGKASNYHQPTIRPDDAAFLQYTSGSTGVPKGTIITRDNLAHNSWLLAEARGHASYIGVSWLPPYHDMGLVGGILQAAFTGSCAILINPMHFLQRPVRWLRAITKYRASLSPAPDFAYRLCVERIRPDERQGLDLSSWSFAFCGAEPVLKKTLDRFAETFAPHGFRREAFMPCYGLAEATLIVTSKRGNGLARELHITSRSLEKRKLEICPAGAADSRVLISSGQPIGDLDVRIVDPDDRRELAAGRVGEIWIHGPSVASGYWDRAGDVAFGARMAGEASGKSYLRTGDLGFLHDGELFVSGRIKNLILIRGRNLHAEDIEQSAAEGHQLLGVCAAFMIDDRSAEDMALVAEVELRQLEDQQARKAELRTVLDGIRASVARHHGVVPASIAVVRRGSLPRTSSGKLRRYAYGSMLSSGELAILAAWRRPAEDGP